jgi:hypothetical protein
MDYVATCIKWLLKSEYIKKNKLFLNAAEAKDNSIQIVTQEISRSQDKKYVDGSVLHKVIFTIFDYKSISFNSLLQSALEKNENIADLLEVGNIPDFVAEMENKNDYPDFGAGFEVQSVYCENSTPSTPVIDNNVFPALAKFSVPIVCEVLEYGH